MITKELLAYIQKQLAKDTVVSLIAQNLKNNGWKEKDIKEGFAALSVSLPQNVFIIKAEVQQEKEKEIKAEEKIEEAESKIKIEEKTEDLKPIESIKTEETPLENISEQVLEKKVEKVEELKEIEQVAVPTDKEKTSSAEKINITPKKALPINNENIIKETNPSLQKIEAVEIKEDKKVHIKEKIQEPNSVQKIIKDEKGEENVEEVIIYEEESHSRFPYSFVFIFLILGARVWGYFNFFANKSQTVVNVNDIIGKTAQIASVSYNNTFVSPEKNINIEGSYNYSDTSVRRMRGTVTVSTDSTINSVEFIQNNSTLFVRFISLDDEIKKEGLVENQWFAVGKNSSDQVMLLSQEDSFLEIAKLIQDISTRHEVGLPFFILLDNTANTIEDTSKGEEETTFRFTAQGNSKYQNDTSGIVVFSTDNLNPKKITLENETIKETILFDYQIQPFEIPQEVNVKTFTQMKEIVGIRKNNTLIKSMMKETKKVLLNETIGFEDSCQSSPLDSLRQFFEDITNVKENTEEGAFSGSPVFFACRDAKEGFIIMASLPNTETLFCIDTSGEKILNKPVSGLSCDN